ncbi:hypothetical protein BaRGS_00010485 [Batillaria attramentaria]|uniref:Uncharacterized protein n=1 Tax=Batillaria attramentaria TaxID=370345 RepID=A0ABD0LFR8_9CAEN
MNALSKLVFQAADAFAPMSSVQLNGGPGNARAGNSKIGISRSLENTKLTDRSSSSSNGVGHRAGGSKDIEFLESADSDRDNSGGTSSERRSSQDGTTPTFYVPTDEPVTVEPVTVDVTTTVIDETDTLSTRL